MHHVMHCALCTVEQIMTRIADVFGVLLTDKLDFDLLRRICASGYTRIPVFANDKRHAEPNPQP